MSRPRSQRRTALGGFVSNGGHFTMREIAGSLHCTIDQANQVVMRARRAGEVKQVGTVRVEGAKRPVAVFAGADACIEGERGLADALQAWGR